MPSLDALIGQWTDQLRATHPELIPHLDEWCGSSQLDCVRCCFGARAMDSRPPELDTRPDAPALAAEARFETPAQGQPGSASTASAKWASTGMLRLA